MSKMWLSSEPEGRKKWKLWKHLKLFLCFFEEKFLLPSEQRKFKVISKRFCHRRQVSGENSTEKRKKENVSFINNEREEIKMAANARLLLLRVATLSLSSLLCVKRRENVDINFQSFHQEFVGRELFSSNAPPSPLYCVCRHATCIFLPTTASRTKSSSRLSTHSAAASDSIIVILYSRERRPLERYGTKLMNIKIQFEAEIVKVLIDFCSTRNNNNRVRVDDDGKRFRGAKKSDAEWMWTRQETDEWDDDNDYRVWVARRKNQILHGCCAIIIFPSAKLDVFYQNFNINSISFSPSRAASRHCRRVCYSNLLCHVPCRAPGKKRNNQIKILPMKIET